MPPFEKSALHLLWVLLTSPAQAAEPTLDFDIPAQTLPAALTRKAYGCKVDSR